MPYCIGLTGGIGCGKSSAAEIFRSLGAGIVDTDDIAHALTKPAGAAITLIRAQFGDEYIDESGAMDRAKMRLLVFADPQSKKKLESILHPLIGRQARTMIERAAEPYLLLVVPLLFETGAYRDIVRRVLVVDCTEDQQVARTMQRSSLSEQAVRAIMANQISRAERIARADDVLHNDGNSSDLREQILPLHNRYLALSRQEPESSLK